MAAQYSNRHFFRKAPNQYLAQFFTAKDARLELDFSKLKENDADAVQTAFNALSMESLRAGRISTFHLTDSISQHNGIITTAAITRPPEVEDHCPTKLSQRASVSFSRSN